ncbi:FG-GAP repeat protein [Planctomycetes bacterium Pla163]|uniref:FG-GAP repeat protein n=1 Tax=Rohdeia mirabilis TaxID=2528008 RepID=A0A518D4J7_9BACT|nr:FG-GAP repeat protein [Planctomycetes bacterium Pla163]
MRPAPLLSLAISLFAAALLAPLALAQGVQPAASVDLGGGSAGTHGVPRMVFDGAPAVGSPFALRMRRCRPFAHGCFVLSASAAPVEVAFFGATVHPQFPVLDVFAFTTDAAGDSPRGFAQLPVAPGLVGCEIVVQGMVEDPLGPNGYAITPGRRVRIGPPASGRLFDFELTLGDVETDVVATGDFDGDGHPDVVVAEEGGRQIVGLGDGAGRFAASYETVNALDRPRAAVVADLDGDGALDFAAVGLRSGTSPTGDLVVHLGDGAGGFVHAFADETLPSLLDTDAADLDGDGDLDLVSVAYEDDLLVVHLGNGDGTFAAAFTSALGDSPSEVALADIDGDGTPDAVVASQSTDEILILPGAGDGTFGAAQSYAFTEPLTLAVADVDGDGLLDVVAASATSIGSLINEGRGTFNPTKETVFTGLGSRYPVELFDRNGDGLVDAVLGRNGLVITLVGDGAGTFTLVEERRAVAGHSGPAFADFDTDGILDVCIGHAWSGVCVAFGDGSGGFGLPAIQPIPAQAFHTAVGDVDLDGIDDLVLRGLTPDLTAILLGANAVEFAAGGLVMTGNTSPGTALVDLDRDGILDLVAGVGNPDPGILVALGDGTAAFGATSMIDTGFVPGDIEAGDVDGDGFVDLVTTSSTPDRVVTYLGDGAGGFGPGIESLPGNMTRTFAATDIDEDGLLDLYMARTFPSESIAILISDGDGTFTVAGSIATGVSPSEIRLHDLDGNGLRDIVVRRTFSPGTAGVAVILALGGGGYSLPTILEGVDGSGPASINVADVDGDTNPDLIASYGNRGRFLVHPGRGDGSFDSPRSFGLVFDQFRLETIDANGDAIADLVVFDGNDAVLRVLENRLLGSD